MVIQERRLVISPMKKKSDTNLGLIYILTEFEKAGRRSSSSSSLSMSFSGSKFSIITVLVVVCSKTEKSWSDLLHLRLPSISSSSARSQPGGDLSSSAEHFLYLCLPMHQFRLSRLLVVKQKKSPISAFLCEDFRRRSIESTTISGSGSPSLVTVSSVFFF